MGKINLRRLHVASAGEQDFKRYRKEVVRTFDQILLIRNLEVKDFNDTNWSDLDEETHKFMVEILRDGIVYEGTGQEVDALVSDPSYRTLRAHLRSALPRKFRRGTLA